MRTTPILNIGTLFVDKETDTIWAIASVDRAKQTLVAQTGKVQKLFTFNDVLNPDGEYTMFVTKRFHKYSGENH